MTNGLLYSPDGWLLLYDKLHENKLY